MKIIHCADMHLDSAMEAYLDTEQASQRRRELLLSFGRLVDFAVEQDVKVILISGDLFDREPVLSSTVRYILGMIDNNPQIEFFYLHGNHDPSAFCDEKLPQNLHMFTNRWQTYYIDNVAVSGIEQATASADALYGNIPDVKNDKVTFHIAMLHGQLADTSGEWLLHRSQLKHKNIDYIALGHLHSYSKEKLDESTTACYCGCPVGRGFDECGEKGFIVLDTDDIYSGVSFYPLARRRFWEIKINITDLSSATEIENAIIEALREPSSDDFVRVELFGRYGEDCRKPIKLWQMRFADEFAYFEIRDNSKLELNPAQYITDASIKGEFVRLVSGADIPERERERILMLGISALDGELVD